VEADVYWPDMKILTTAISCGAIAVLCSGCMVDEIRELAQCDVIKNQFNDFQAMAAKGEVMFGVKVYETEAEIKEALEANLEHYGAFWEKYNCPGSLTDPN